MVLNIETKQQLEHLLAKPSSATQDDIPFLQQLIKTFPYYQPLHLLLAKASSNSENKQTAFTKAALYTNGGILHRVIHETQQLNGVQDFNTINYQPWNSDHFFGIAKSTPLEEVKESTLQPADNFIDNLENENLEALPTHVIEAAGDLKEEPETTLNTSPVIADAPEIENLEPLVHETIAVETPEEVEAFEEEEIENVPYSAPTIADAPEIENLEPLPNEVIKVCEPEITIEEPKSENVILEADEQETFEEIAEFVAPIQEVSPKDTEPFIETEEQIAPIDEVVIAEEIQVADIETIENEASEIEEITESKNEEPLKETEAEEEELELESVASFDFFAFDRNFGSDALEEEPEVVAEKVVEEPIVHANTAQENIVSKYDDDQLPFTFLWWLAKTRKDHEQIFRPFASPVKANAQPLQQQYVEHIFHIQAPLDLGEEAQTNVSVLATKGNEIIENFIKNDPQIKALKPDQINNENKAKRSAEDSNDVVSETLAQIYIEQMLYHKAIDTYQKLSLKFPEKSGYFADLIQSLEKKI